MEKLKIVIFAAALFVLTASCISFKEKKGVDKKPFIGFNNEDGNKVNLFDAKETVWEWSAVYEK